MPDNVKFKYVIIYYHLLYFPSWSIQRDVSKESLELSGKSPSIGLCSTSGWRNCLRRHIIDDLLYHKMRYIWMIFFFHASFSEYGANAMLPCTAMPHHRFIIHYFRYREESIIMMVIWRVCKDGIASNGSWELISLIFTVLI